MKCPVNRCRQAPVVRQNAIPHRPGRSVSPGFSAASETFRPAAKRCRWWKRRSRTSSSPLFSRTSAVASGNGGVFDQLKGVAIGAANCGPAFAQFGWTEAATLGNDHQPSHVSCGKSCRLGYRPKGAVGQTSSEIQRTGASLAGGQSCAATLALRCQRAPDVWRIMGLHERFWRPSRCCWAAEFSAKEARRLPPTQSRSVGGFKRASFGRAIARFVRGRISFPGRISGSRIS